MKLLVCVHGLGLNSCDDCENAIRYIEKDKFRIPRNAKLTRKKWISQTYCLKNKRMVNKNHKCISYVDGMPF